jgi:hypothetical protein
MGALCAGMKSMANAHHLFFLVTLNRCQPGVGQISGFAWEKGVITDRIGESSNKKLGALYTFRCRHAGRLIDGVPLVHLPPDISAYWFGMSVCSLCPWTEFRV